MQNSYLARAKKVQVFQMGYHQYFWHVGGHAHTGLWMPLVLPEVARELCFFLNPRSCCA